MTQNKKLQKYKKHKRDEVTSQEVAQNTKKMKVHKTRSCKKYKKDETTQNKKLHKVQ